jgi:carbonic anhydrase
MDDIARFIKGFKQFQSNYFAEEQGLFAVLKKGQNPNTLVIGCSDSRIDPAVLFGCDPGELFVVRNVANLVPPHDVSDGYHGVSAALEYAVLTLEVEHIIVLGHAQCGGIGALMDGLCDKGATGFIAKWMQIVERAREQVLRELPDKRPVMQARACEQAAILVSLENLMTFPWIRSRMETGLLQLHGWYFDIEAGRLFRYSSSSSSFELLP